MRELLSRIRALFRRKELDDRLDEEVCTHLDELTEDHIRRGATPEQARLAARRDFGGIEPMKDTHRDRRGVPWADALRQDLVFAARQLRRRPGMAAIAILTIGLSMAAAIAVFTVVNGVLLRPLPYPDPDQLVVAHSKLAQFGRVPVSDAQHRAWRDALKSIDGFALLWGYDVNLSGGGPPERVPAARVSPALFAVLGVQPQLGRMLRDDEDQPGRDRVVVISDALWRGRFGGNPNVVGAAMAVNGEPHEIVGVLPRGFRFPRISRLYSIPISTGQPELWKPLALTPNDLLRGLNFAAIARLRPGVTIRQAQSELDALQRTLIPSDVPGGGNVTIPGEFTALREQITGGSRRSLEVLLAAVGAVLLIACLNVTNLILSRSATRTRELAVRSAVGATRGRLARQLFTEGLVVSLVAGVAALAMAGLALRLLVLAAPVDIPRLDEVRIDSSTLIVAALLTAATSVILGVLPAWRLPRLTLQVAAQKEGRGAATLLIAQLAATALCAIVAGVLLHSLVTLLSVNRGFEVANIVTGDLELAGPAYNGRRLPLERSILEGLRAVPGVVAVSLSSQQLLSGTGMNLRVVADGASVPVTERPLANFRTVNADFFRTFGIAIVRGHPFAEIDARPVAVVSESTATRLWPGEDAVGKRLRRGPDSLPPLEVVGVAADVRASRLEQPAGPIVYLPFWQAPPAQFSLAVKTNVGVEATTAAMRDVLRRIDPTLPLSRVRTMSAVMSEAVGERRFLTTLVVLFSASAALLAAIGVYGVISQRVTRRTTEIGLRVALGAQRSSLVRMVLGDAWRLLAIGLALAVPIALVSGSLLQTLLFEVTPYDPRTIGVVCLAMSAVATAAAYGPARRASRVDATVALRAE
jgi:putative ABC transport system permease protein